MIKDILVHVDAGHRDDDPGLAARYATALAAQHRAHLTGCALGVFSPALSLAYAPEVGVVDEVPAGASEQDVSHACKVFERVVGLEGVSFQTLALTGEPGDLADAFAAAARTSDLVIVAQDEPGSPGFRSRLIEAALLDGGRPVLIVPYIQRDAPAMRHVLVAWDHSRAAARAAHDAMPLLRKAARVEVLFVEDGRSDEQEVPGADLAAHLARHGLPVEVRRIYATGSDVAAAVLSHAADSGADFLVMGGYDHSRLREFLLGGTTRGILEAMTVPVLMSH